ncbi:BatD family protein [Desulfovibrio sp. TomC]|uniref:BatD family protein n=1 Tax=Desulfovibrio sp. TomC TaxID=1562888 RepID=UPI0005749501|nr:BatD family protein [Desulfovibrio sp. TomC]KHK00862.1 BatD [Desulfovibrio sp. TomC]
MALAETAVTVEVDPRETIVGRPVTLRVLVPGDALAVIDTAPIVDCTVTPRGRIVGSRTGPDGRPAPVTAYRFELTPRRSGDCRIPALAVETGGARLTTSPATVVVRPEPAPPPALAGKTVLLDAALSRANPYRGQTVVYTVSLFRSVAASGIAVTPPAFDGFAAVALPGQTDAEVTAGGKRYAVSHVDYALTPLRAGRLVLPPAQARLSGIPGASGPMVIDGAPLEITVRPLPPVPAGLPASELVGQMELDARLDAASVAVGQEVGLESILAGRGNLTEAALPTPQLPPGLSARRLATKDDGGNGPDGFTGRRTVHFALRAQSPGRYTLPGPRLAVFDPDRGTWRVLAAPETVLAVTAAPAPDAALAPPLLAPAASAATLAAAQADYASGRFAEAATGFEASLKAGCDGAALAVCLDAATSWRLAGEPGRAALWLYRAGLAQPGDGTIVKAQTAAGLPPLSPGLLLGNRLPRRTMLAAGGMAAGLLVLLLLAAWRWRPLLPRGAWLMAGILAGWLALEAGWLALAPALAPRGVATTEVAALSAPEAGAETLFTLPPGALVRLGPRRNGFVRVDAGNDALGWVVRDTAVTRLP